MKAQRVSWAFSLGGGLGEEGVNGAQESVLIAPRQVLDLLQATQHLTRGLAYAALCRLKVLQILLAKPGFT
jgi:hypothetical protein